MSRIGRFGGLAGAIVALVLLVPLLSSCGSGHSQSGTGTGQRSLHVVLAWYPTAEYGGLYAALKEGYFRKAGLDVRVQSGGPNVVPEKVVASNRAQIGFGGSDSEVLIADASYPFSLVGTEFAISPEGFEYHLGHSISSLADLADHVIYVVPGDPAYEWATARYHVHHVKTEAFDYAVFAHNPRGIEFGFVTDDGPTLAADGVRIGYILPSRLGFNENGDVLFTAESYAQSHRTTVAEFLKALQQGWVYYGTHYHAVDQVIYSADKSIPVRTEDAIARAELPYVFGGVARSDGVLTLTRDEVAKVASALKDLGLLKQHVNLNKAVVTGLTSSKIGAHSGL